MSRDSEYNHFNKLFQALADSKEALDAIGLIRAEEGNPTAKGFAQMSANFALFLDMAYKLAGSGWVRPN